MLGGTGLYDNARGTMTSHAHQPLAASRVPALPARRLVAGAGRPVSGAARPAGVAGARGARRDGRTTHLRELFADDPARGERLNAEAAGWFLDYSKQRVTDETLALLVALAEDCGVPERIEAMFRGERINVTEDRPVLHVALRAPRDASIVVDGEDVVPQVHEVLDRMAAFSDRVRSGEWRGHTGEPIRAVVNIGIGGSDLGPAMATRALRAYTDRGRVPVRLERRRRRLRRGDPRPRSGDDALRRRRRRRSRRSRR